MVRQSFFWFSMQFDSHNFFWRGFRGCVRSDPDKDISGWGENDRGVSFTFGSEVVGKFLHKHDMDLICRAHQVGLLVFFSHIHTCIRQSTWIIYDSAGRNKSTMDAGFFATSVYMFTEASPGVVLYIAVVSSYLEQKWQCLICSCDAVFEQVVEDGYEFFAKRQLVTLFSAPNYCGEFDNAGAMMSVDDTLMCSFQILKPAEKKSKYPFGGADSGRPITPPRGGPKKKWT